jgi:CobQ-like glutamine amidotransferase family enzyme
MTMRREARPAGRRGSVGADLRIVHLYPDLLRTYGDRGNVLALRRRAEWRGFRIEVAAVSRGERIPADAGLILLGGGTDRVQEAIGEDLIGRRPELEDAVARGAVVLGVCGGYQFLGAAYVAADGTVIEGIGLLDVETRAGEDRLIGRVRATARLWEEDFELVGFENHGGRTTLGPAATALAAVEMGGGNDGRDSTEGAVQGTVVGTYLHGPVLPLNPAFADALLRRALAPRTGGVPLARLDDELETAAHTHALALPR